MSAFILHGEWKSETEMRSQITTCAVEEDRPASGFKFDLGYIPFPAERAIQRNFIGRLLFKSVHSYVLHATHPTHSDTALSFSVAVSHRYSLPSFSRVSRSPQGPEWIKKIDCMHCLVTDGLMNIHPRVFHMVSYSSKSQCTHLYLSRASAGTFGSRGKGSTRHRWNPWPIQIPC